MAANSREVVASSTARKKKLPSMKKLIEHGKEALGSNRKKEENLFTMSFVLIPPLGSLFAARNFGGYYSLLNSESNPVQ